MISRKTIIIVTLLPLLIVLSACAAGRYTVALVFSDSVMVNDTVIRLSDIASITAPAEIKAQLKSYAVGEPAPAGFNRFVNADDLVRCNLAAVFPLASFSYQTGKRMTVSTDDTTASVADYEKEITAYLKQNSPASVGTFTFSILNRDRTWKCLNRPFSVSVEGEMKDAGIGNFGVTLKVVQGNRILTIPVLCRSKLRCMVVVTVGTVGRGEIIRPADCKLIEKEIQCAAFFPYTALSDVSGYRATRTIPGGTILNEQLIEKVPAVNKGDLVTISARQGAVSISLTGIARQSGSPGERIWVENTLSRRLVQAVVTGMGKAEISTQGVSL